VRYFQHYELITINFSNKIREVWKVYFLDITRTLVKTSYIFFDVLLTVHLSIFISVFNQLIVKQILCIKLVKYWHKLHTFFWGLTGYTHTKFVNTYFFFLYLLTFFHGCSHTSSILQKDLKIYIYKYVTVKQVRVGLKLHARGTSLIYSLWLFSKRL